MCSTWLVHCLQALVLVTGTMTAAMPVLGLTHVAIGALWLHATFALSVIMRKETGEPFTVKPESAQGSEGAAAVAAEPPTPPSPAMSYR